MECKIFYSWQSDLPNSTNRSFIEKALENAIKAIRDDESIKLEPVIDRDTSGQPGSPDIAKTILGKIEKSQIFICDVSITNNNIEGRKTPNPNVLYELGFAHKALGEDRIINVLNTFYGKPEDLPFDIRMRRAVTYILKENEVDKQTERKKLESNLEYQIRTIIKIIENQPKETTPTPLDIVKEAIITNSPLKKKYMKDYMKWLVTEIEKISPNYSDDIEVDESLVYSIGQSIELVSGFCEISELICDVDSTEDINLLLHGLEKLLDHYLPKDGFSGQINEREFDFYKFLGHELFVSLISFLLSTEKWDILKSVLNEDYSVQGSNYRNGIVDFSYFSEYVGLLEFRNKRLNLGRVCLHGDILFARHSEGYLAEKVNIVQFVDCDLFLSIKGNEKWRPWSAIHLSRRIPGFLMKAIKISKLSKLMEIMGITNIVEFKQYLIKNFKFIRAVFARSIFYDPFESFDIDSLGTIE